MRYNRGMSLKEKLQNLSKYSIVTCFLAMELFAFFAFSFSGNFLVYGIFASIIFVLLVLFSIYEIKVKGISKIAFLFFPLMLFSLLTAVGYYSLNHVILGDFSAAEVVFIPIGILTVGFSGYLLSLNKTFKIKTFLIVIYSALAVLVIINFLTTTINFGPFHTIFYKNAYMYYGGLRSSTPVGKMAYTLEGFRVIETTINHYTLYPALLLSSSTMLLYISFKEEKKLYILYICFTALALLALIFAPSITGLFAVIILVVINLYLFFAKRYPKVRKGMNIALISGISLSFVLVFIMILCASSTSNFVKDIVSNNALLNKLFITNGVVSRFNLVIRDIFTSRYFLGFSHYFVTEYYADEIFLTGSYIFDTFMTSGVIGALGLFVFIWVGFKSYKKYFKLHLDDFALQAASLLFLILFIGFSAFFNKGEYALYYKIYRPIYLTSPFMTMVFIFTYVFSKTANHVEPKKEELVNE